MRHVRLAFAFAGLAAASVLLIVDAYRNRAELQARRAAGESDFERFRRRASQR